MIFSIIKTSLFSLLFIALIHHLFIFFKNMLTVPKIKDLINSPTERYNEMLDTLQKTSLINQNQNQLNSIGENNINKINNEDNMNSELTNFLQDLKISNHGSNHGYNHGYNKVSNKLSSFSEINNNHVIDSTTIINSGSSAFSEF